MVFLVIPSCSKHAQNYPSGGHGSFDSSSGFLDSKSISWCMLHLLGVVVLQSNEGDGCLCAAEEYQQYVPGSFRKYDPQRVTDNDMAIYKP